MTKLITGTYYIKSKSTGGFIGRSLREDKSLLPKSVILSPEETETWDLVVCSPEEIILRARGAPTVAQGQRIVALLIEQENAEKWRITLDERSGKSYIIESHNREGGWVAPDEAGDAIVFRPLIATKSIPPMYPDNQLWEIIPLVD